MTRCIAIVLVFFLAFLILLAEVSRMDAEVVQKIEQQRRFNAHQ